jgi:hypothetical protein
MRSDPTAPREGRFSLIDHRWESLSAKTLLRLGFSEKDVQRMRESGHAP